jgi:hypothetical protein
VPVVRGEVRSCKSLELRFSIVSDGSVPRLQTSSHSEMLLFVRSRTYSREQPAVLKGSAQPLISISAKAASALTSSQCR